MLDGPNVAALWDEFNDARRALDGARTPPFDLNALRQQLKRLRDAEAALDFDDEQGQPTAVIDADQRIAVLLPLRIETRFRQRAGGWLLQVRLFPEPIAFDQRLRPAPGQTRAIQIEQKSLEEFWASAGGRLDSATAAAAFRVLADALGTARAVWLVRHVGVHTTATGVAVDPVPAPPSLMACLPARLGVWLARGGQPVLSKVLQLDPAEIAEQNTIERLAATGATFDGLWWNSFKVAKDVGLACEIELGPDPAIDLLLVAGVGDVPASELFAAHADAGRLGILAPGTATNAVDGGATVSIDPGPDEWFSLLSRPGWGQAGTRQLATYLTGDPESLLAVPGGDVDVRTSAQRATPILVPAVLGRALHDEWRLGLNGHAAGRWAARWLLPGGPCPSFRIGDVPYGVAPAAAALARWVIASDDPAVEQAILQHAHAASAVATVVAETHGTIAGANPEQVLNLLAVSPVSPNWAARAAMPLPVVALASAGLSSGLGPVDTQQLFEDAAHDALKYVPPPVVPVLAIGNRIPIGRDRVDRDRLHPQTLVELAHAPWSDTDERRRAVQDYVGERLIGIERRRADEPRHLVEYLVDASIVLTHARMVSALAGGDATLSLLDLHQLQTLVAPTLTPPQRDAVTASGPLGEEVSRAWHDLRYSLDAFLRFEHEPVELVDAALGLLDAASHRANQWITGVADRRVRRLARAGVPFVIGAYGWVDDPAPASLDPRPAPGPTQGGLIHAPGADHAATAALLRDRAVNTPSGRWDIALDSTRIRSALRLTAYVRAGITIAEALGREAERIIGAPERVHELRRKFAARPEAAGRQVCDGELVVAAAAAGHPRHNESRERADRRDRRRAGAVESHHRRGGRVRRPAHDGCGLRARRRSGSACSGGARCRRWSRPAPRPARPPDSAYGRERLDRPVRRAPRGDGPSRRGTRRARGPGARRGVRPTIRRTRGMGVGAHDRRHASHAERRRPRANRRARDERSDPCLSSRAGRHTPFGRRQRAYRRGPRARARDHRQRDPSARTAGARGDTRRPSCRESHHGSRPAVCRR